MPKQRPNTTNTKGAIQLQATKQELYSGPIPHPEILSGYDNIVPGSADRLIIMAEREMEHRHKMESEIVEAEIRDSHIGMVFGFSLGILSLIAAVVAIIFAPSNAGAIIGGLLGVTGIGSIIGVFVKSTRIKHPDNTERRGPEE